MDAVSRTVQPEVQRRFLTSTLCLLIDLFSITAQHYGRTLNEIDRLAGDEALKKSIQQYTIHVDDIIVPVYRREMDAPIEDMKRFLDGLLHIFDKGCTRVDTVYLYKEAYAPRTTEYTVFQAQNLREQRQKARRQDSPLKEVREVGRAISANL